MYCCATSLITGANSVQSLMTIENPSGSTINVYIMEIRFGGIATASSASPFLYHIGRATGLPTGGTILTSQKYDSSIGSATGIVRQSPTATASAGSMWVSTPGVILSGGLLGGPVSMSQVSFIFTPILDFNNALLLVPGEALIITGDANSTSWNHFGSVSWLET